MLYDMMRACFARGGCLDNRIHRFAARAMEITLKSKSSKSKSSLHRAISQTESDDNFRVGTCLYVAMGAAANLRPRFRRSRRREEG